MEAPFIRRWYFQVRLQAIRGHIALCALAPNDLRSKRNPDTQAEEDR